MFPETPDLLAKLMISDIRRGYGANCESKDNEDFPDHPVALNAEGRCASCRAQEVIRWLEEHIRLIQT